MFASPDNSRTIHIQTGTSVVLEGTPDPDTYERYDSIDISDDNRILMIGKAPIDSAAEFDAIFDTVFESIEISE